MPAAEVVNLDDYEHKKLVILTFEKLNAFGACFFFVSGIALCAIELGVEAFGIFVALVEQPADVGPIIRGDIISFLFVLPVLAMLYAAVYFSRATGQSRPRFIRRVRIALLPLVAVLAYVMYAIPALQQLYAFVWRLYTAHWASVLEVTIVLAAATLASVDWWRGNRVMWRLTERDKLFVREDPEQGFYRGRVLRTALGIPRIVDLMPRRRHLAMAEFVLANFFFSMSIGWTVVYAVFFSYRWFVVLVFFNGVVTVPYVQETAVSHMLFSLSVTSLVYLISPIVGGYILSFAQHNVHWSIAELLRVDSRSPILFLRAFKDDQVQLKKVKLKLFGRLGRWLDAVSNLDRLLLEEATPYGPVVAIGNPSDRLPPYGAARGYFDDKTWRSAVADLAAKAMAIVICLDRTEGIWWEVDHIARLGYLPKTLFLIHPKDSAAAENRAIADEVTQKLAPESPPATLDRADGSATVGATMNGTLLGFFFDEVGVMHAGRSTTFSQIAYLIQVRWFLRSKFGFAMPAGNERGASQAAAQVALQQS